MPRASRPTRAQIDRRAILHNLRSVQSFVGRSTIVMPVVKANAYGHGIVEVSTFLEHAGFRYFGVANAEEGVLLRRAGITSPIHVFTLSTKEQAALIVRYRLEPTIATPESIRIISREAERSRRRVDVHLKIETGMNRIGIADTGVARALSSVARSRRLNLKGVYTHFATADIPRSGFVKQQLRRFDDALDTIRSQGAEPEMIHAANSGAIIGFPETRYTMVRPGIMMYGYSPAGPRDPRADLRPAMRFVSRVSQVKRISGGESVSYGRTFRARRPVTVATIPVGYADGVFRGLSGKGTVLVNGSRRPIIGRVCMDQIMIDCGRVDVSPGDEVVLIGRQGTRSVSAWDQALLLKTIPYELTCAVSARVPREYIS